jgi:hypothetical protein
MHAINLEPMRQQYASGAARFTRAGSFKPARSFVDGLTDGRHDKQNALSVILGARRNSQRETQSRGSANNLA